MQSGVSLKAQHYRMVLDSRPAAGFFEVHAENFMGAGGPPHRYLEAIRGHYPLSIHGVGLNIGGSQPLDRSHLQRLKDLLDRYQPELFSEHLAWSSHGGLFLNDLLPLPYTRSTLELVCNHIDETQAFLGRRMLLENPSTYVTFAESTLTEEEFIGEIAKRTGCGLLLDINNAYVSSVNQRREPTQYLDRYPLEHVEQFHLAGFAETRDPDGERLLIDTHGDQVHVDVWQLYAGVVSRAPAAPTLIEWDNDVPEWPTLIAEARKADAIIASVQSPPGAAEPARAGGAR
ncbi:MAG: DUF692 domain-containing protein [Steroidobacteraceae bacterium]